MPVLALIIDDVPKLQRLRGLSDASDQQKLAEVKEDARLGYSSLEQ